MPKRSYSILFDKAAEKAAIRRAKDEDERIDEDMQVEVNKIISNTSEIFAYVRLTFPEHVLDSSIFDPDGTDDEIDGKIYDVETTYLLEDEDGALVHFRWLCTRVR